MTKSQRSAHPPMVSRARHLRRQQTPAEGRLWRALRDRRLEGHKFRRQHPIGPCVVDFLCQADHLVIEIDGDSHAEQEQYDQMRTEWLAKEGYRLVRFSNSDVMHRLEGVVEAILEELDRGR